MSTLSGPTEPSEEAGTGLGLPIAIFASAQFVMVLDSSVMNVSISQIVADSTRPFRAFSWPSRCTRW